jgi:hypothetical protein
LLVHPWWLLLRPLPIRHQHNLRRPLSHLHLLPRHTLRQTVCRWLRPRLTLQQLPSVQSLLLHRLLPGLQRRPSAPRLRLHPVQQLRRGRAMLRRWRLPPLNPRPLWWKLNQLRNRLRLRSTQQLPSLRSGGLSCPRLGRDRSTQLLKALRAAFSADAPSSNVHARKLRAPQVRILLLRWRRAHGDRCIRRARSPQGQARLDVRALLRAGHDLRLERGRADWVLRRGRASRRQACDRRHALDSGAEDSATRRPRKAR